MESINEIDFMNEMTFKPPTAKDSKNNSILLFRMGRIDCFASFAEWGRPKGMNEFALVASLFCGLRAAAAALLRKEEKTATNKANGFTSRGEKTAATKPPNSISLIIKEMRVGVELVC